MSSRNFSRKEILRMIENKEVSPVEGYKLLQEIKKSKQIKCDLDNLVISDPIGNKGENLDQEPLYQAVIVDKPGNINDIGVLPINVQELREREVLILVRAFSLNFSDLLCVKGLYPTMPEYPFTPGFEVSGIVLKTGRSVSKVREGDKVIALMGPKLGGHSYIAITDENLVVKKPGNISYEEACSFPVVFLTMHHVFEKADIHKGEKVLIQTAAGGIGLIAVQLALAKGAEIYATVGSQEKMNYLKQMGVNHLINYREEDFARKILEITDNYGVDVVINTLSGDAIQKGIDILAPRGRYIEIAVTGLKSSRKLDLSNMVDNQTFYSIDLRKLSLGSSYNISKYLDEMAYILEQGTIRPTVGKIFSFAKIKEAYRCMENRENIGKIVVSIPESVDVFDEIKSTVSPHRTLGANSYEFKSEQKSPQDVAIIGIACRFPQAKNVDEFWQNLAQGKNSIIEVPLERWDNKTYYDPDPNILNKTNCKWGGFLDDIEKFDPLFFNMSGKEAILTDPQQRTFLEESWAALEDAGYATEDISDQKCAVFVGVTGSDYGMKILKGGIDREAQSYWGNASSILASRISYFLNLKGPSVAVDTACSSSLVAIHLGCQSILNGENEMVIAGGVFLTITPDFHIMSSNAGMLSPEGKCKTFDNGADGFVPGEGVGVVILKSLDKAIKDGDHIYGVIKGSAINQDGKTNGITAPSTISQTELELSAYKKFNIHPETIGFVEAHGTGTKLGDPIEIEALTNAFRHFTDRKHFCAVGSVKTNIGHTVASAGVASVIKVLLALKYKKIPPSLNFCQENEHIIFKDSPFYVNTQIIDWKTMDDKPRRAAVSSFGFSGTNAHMIIEEPPVREHMETLQSSAYLFPFSAKSHNSLEGNIKDFLDWLQSEGKSHSIGDISYTLNICRSHFSIRLAVVARDFDELIRTLNQFQSDRQVDNCFYNNLKKVPSKLDPAAKQIGASRINALLKPELQESEYKAKLLELAEFYVKGYELEWRNLYTGQGYRCVSLPTYHFSRKTYWIPETSTNGHETPEKCHPLLDRANLGLSLQHQGIVYEKTFRSSDVILKDHKVLEQAILPGVGYLELAYAVISKIDDTMGVGLNKVVWLQPLKMEKAEKTLRVVVKKEKEQLCYEIQSKDDSNTVIHSQGEFCFVEKTSQESMRQRLSIAEIKERCTFQVDKETIYAQFRESGITYGPYFQGLNHIWGNNEEALGLIKIQPQYEAELSHFTLHPTIMECALQTVVGLSFNLDERSEKLKAPFSLEKVEVLHPIRAYGYAYVKSAGEDCYKIDVLDETGLVCVKLHGLALREQKDTLQDFFYIPRWEQLSLNDAQTVMPEQGKAADSTENNVLIISPSQDLGLAKILAEAHSEGKVKQIVLGTEERRYSEDTREIRVDDPLALHNCIQQIRNIKTIYFLGGIQTEEVDISDLEQLRQSQERGVISMFRLVKSLIALDIGAQAVNIKVVTNNVVPVFPREMIKPYAASIDGFVKSLVKEYPKWVISCIDVDLENQSEEEQMLLVKSILAEPGNLKGEMVALRNGKRYMRSLKPVRLSPKNLNPFRKNGVYIILGGAGGIGLELGCYLAEMVQARLILVGRSEFNTVQKEKVALIQSKGGQVLYLQANATDFDSMKAAIGQAKSHFGKIHGVFHSAIVLRDKSLGNMDEENFRSALDPKIDGSVVLHKVLQGESLDFIMFFSSAQSFSGAAGQSNYAAGCTFKDAFAQYLNLTEPYPVKIINWGYWGSVGIVATDAYNKRLKTQGLRSIAPKEGMEAVRRVLAHGIDQVMAIKADNRLLEIMGVDVRDKMDQRVLFDFQQAFTKVERISQCLLLRTFQKMGLFESAGEKYNKEELKDQLGILPRYFSLFEALLEILAKAGFVEIKGHDICVCRTFESPELQNELKSTRNSMDELVIACPEIKAHINLLSTCFESYPKILRGQVPATDILFPHSSMELVEGVYKGNKVADYYNRLVVESLLSYIKARLSELAENEKIKILEVGAGTGGTSSEVFNTISPFGDQLQYTYTDVSSGFLQYGQDHYGKNNPYVEFKLLDIEKNIREQGFAAGDFDVIIASNVLHATRKVCNTLQNLKTLLKTNGCLVINELTRVHDFATLTFGLLDGWWLFEDAENRLKGSPLLSSVTWDRLLRENGFEKVCILGESQATGINFGQNVIVVQNNGRVTLGELWPVGKEKPGIGEERTEKVQVHKLKHDVGKAGDEKLIIAEKIIEGMASILQIDKNELDINSPYADFGVDSILAVKIINKINEELNINLRTTDLYNFSTVEMLSDYIAEKYDLALKGRYELKAEIRESFKPISKIVTEREQMLSQVSASIASPSSSSGLDIAIVGISAKFPDAKDINEYWTNLESGKNSVKEITRWDLNEFYDPNPQQPDKTNCKWGGLLSDIDKFDPLFFNISPKEAELMDPQQRLFLEEAWKALEDAGYSDKYLKNKKCGVFVGCGLGDYLIQMRENNVPAGAYGFMGNNASILAARISYFLNLKGPSIAIDTACSSSLVAVHLACESIISGTCEFAVAGGVAIFTTPSIHIMAGKAGMLSSDGQCRTFDQRANGFVPGEGVGAVVLKSLQSAIQDGDHIYGIIKGSGINQDGRTNGITAPSAPSQTALECEVYDKYNIDPESISYVEAHGTGTKLGDPIEIDALTDAFRKYTSKRQYCAIGSVKTNIGHALTAAGVAGLIKVLLCLKYKKIVPSINLEKENSYINFKDSPFYVNTGVREWKTEHGVPRCAAISSFGFSGTNAHLVISEPPEQTKKEQQSPELPYYMIPVSAKTDEALIKKLEDLLQWLKQGQNINIRDLTYTLHLGRSHFNIRMVWLVRNLEELVHSITIILNGGKTENHLVNTLREAHFKPEPVLKMIGERLLNELQENTVTEAKYKEKLLVLADLFIKGYELDWERLYKGGDYQRLSLPTYPFAKERYWITEVKRPTAVDKEQNSDPELHLLDAGLQLLSDDEILDLLKRLELGEISSSDVKHILGVI